MAIVIRPSIKPGGQPTVTIDGTRVPQGPSSSGSSGGRRGGGGRANAPQQPRVTKSLRDTASKVLGPITNIIVRQGKITFIGPGGKRFTPSTLRLAAEGGISSSEFGRRIGSGSTAEILKQLDAAERKLIQQRQSITVDTKRTPSRILIGRLPERSAKIKDISKLTRAERARILSPKKRIGQESIAERALRKKEIRIQNDFFSAIKELGISIAGGTTQLIKGGKKSPRKLVQVISYLKSLNKVRKQVNKLSTGKISEVDKIKAKNAVDIHIIKAKAIKKKINNDKEFIKIINSQDAKLAGQVAVLGLVSLTGGAIGGLTGAIINVGLETLGTIFTIRQTLETIRSPTPRNIGLLAFYAIPTALAAVSILRKTKIARTPINKIRLKSIESTIKRQRILTRNKLKKAAKSKDRTKINQLKQRQQVFTQALMEINFLKGTPSLMSGKNFVKNLKTIRSSYFKGIHKKAITNPKKILGLKAKDKIRTVRGEELLKLTKPRLGQKLFLPKKLKVAELAKLVKKGQIKLNKLPNKLRIRVRKELSKTKLTAVKKKIRGLKERPIRKAKGREIKLAIRRRQAEALARKLFGKRPEIIKQTTPIIQKQLIDLGKPSITLAKLLNKNNFIVQLALLVKKGKIKLNRLPNRLRIRVRKKLRTLKIKSAKRKIAGLKERPLRKAKGKAQKDLLRRQKAEALAKKLFEKKQLKEKITKRKIIPSKDLLISLGKPKLSRAALLKQRRSIVIFARLVIKGRVKLNNLPNKLRIKVRKEVRKLKIKDIKKKEIGLKERPIRKAKGRLSKISRIKQQRIKLAEAIRKRRKAKIQSERMKAKSVRIVSSLRTSRDIKTAQSQALKLKALLSPTKKLTPNQIINIAKTSTKIKSEVPKLKARARKDPFSSKERLKEIKRLNKIDREATNTLTSAQGIKQKQILLLKKPKLTKPITKAKVKQFQSTVQKQSVIIKSQIKQASKLRLNTLANALNNQLLAIIAVARLSQKVTPKSRQISVIKSKAAVKPIVDVKSKVQQKVIQAVVSKTKVDTKTAQRVIQKIRSMSRLKARLRLKQTLKQPKKVLIKLLEERVITKDKIRKAKKRAKLFIFRADLIAAFFGQKATKKEARDLLKVGKVFTGLERRKIVSRKQVLSILKKLK